MAAMGIMLLLPRPTQMLRPILKGSVFELLVCILKQVGFTSVYWPAYCSLPDGYWGQMAERL